MRTLWVSFIVLLVPTGALFAQSPSPQAIIERAIAAHGGRERLAQVKADRVRLRGTVSTGEHSLAFENEVTVALPGRFKSVMRLTLAPGKVQTLVHIIDGDLASVTLDGQPLPLPAAQNAQLRQSLQTDQAVRLVPLLTDPAFTLYPLPETTVNGRASVGVRVTGHGQREVRLYFDVPSGLLVKTEHLLDGGGKDVKQEIFYSQFREAGGYLRPGKVTALRDGRKVMEADLIDATPLERIDPTEFAAR